MMKDLFLKIQNSHDVIFKALLLAICAAVIIYALPKEGKFKYDFKQGKPWLHENLYAPFDFAVLKSTQDLEQEKIEIQKNSPLYFNHSDSISTEVLSDFYNNIFLGVVGYDKERILSQKTFKINGYLAQRGEYLISNEGNDVYVNAISFWYKTRHYFIQHGTVGKKSSEEEINNFLNSFKLLKE